MCTDKLLRIILLTQLAASCGHNEKTETTSSADAVEIDPEAQLAENCAVRPEDAASEIRLKDVALLGSSLVGALGAGSTRDVTSGENLLEIYAPNFGGADADRKVGAVSDDQIGGNSVRSDYFMALNYVAYNAGLYCEANKELDSRCRCDTEESARLMLARAVPYQNWCASNEIVLELATLCKKSSKDSITALFSSVAFAKRN
jgi:hypothetical protein